MSSMKEVMLRLVKEGVEEHCADLEGRRRSYAAAFTALLKPGGGGRFSWACVSEFSTLPEVQQLKEAMLETILEGRAQRSERALRSSGATIDIQRTSKSYEWAENGFCRALWLLCSAAKPPETILQPDVTPGQCWAFQGSQGQVVVRLPAPVQPTAVTVQHIYKAASPSGTVSSAPRDVTVSGVDEEGEEETLLGAFTYDVEAEAIQSFPLKHKSSRAFQYIKLSVQSNWGNPEYTCIYRVQVHGQVASRSSSPAAEETTSPSLNKK
ncbi:SUN domain-containing protein 5-like [Rhea pennata]|uniref:SUN domain-containing protein 5-like n=1 Tax=Rhea pennata TaxID=8795 RepID=UPI002E26B590